MVQKIKDPRYGYVGPFRVWQKNGVLPGLAMSRSFGDVLASKVGKFCIFIFYVIYN